MEILNIEKTQNTPEVKLNHLANTLEFYGECRPEDSKLFFAPVFYWLTEYKLYLNKTSSAEKIIIKATFKFEYYNSSSQKLIMDIFFLLTDLKANLPNLDVVVNWHHHEDDEDTRDSGSEFEGLTKLKFNIISYN